MDIAWTNQRGRLNPKSCDGDGDCNCDWVGFVGRLEEESSVMLKKQTPPLCKISCSMRHFPEDAGKISVSVSRSKQASRPWTNNVPCRHRRPVRLCRVHQNTALGWGMMYLLLRIHWMSLFACDEFCVCSYYCVLLLGLVGTVVAMVVPGCWFVVPRGGG